jgi:DNA polymerase I-like protein with 3'-5' exonuclease and polymerase domains
MIYLVTTNQQLFTSPYYTIISLEDALNILQTWDIIQFDTETNGRDAHICDFLCIQFGNKHADVQIIVDTITINISSFKSLLETKLIVGHNLKFDIQFLYKYNIIPTKVWDTMIIEQLLHLGYDNKFFHYSLKAVAERRLNIDIDKSTRGEIIWRGLDDKVILYAAGDVMYLEDIRDQQLKDCEIKQCKKAAQIENAFVPVIAYLEWCGIKLDIVKWQAKIAENEKLRDEALNELNQWVVNYYKQHKGSTITPKVRNVVPIYDYRVEKSIPLPKNATIIGKPYDCGAERYVEIEEPTSWISINTQGDLFTGFDSEPKCCINWASSSQTIPFFQMLGFNTSTKDKKTGENKDTVVEKMLIKQKGIADDFLKLYLTYKKKFKDCSTYGQNYIDAINPITGRIHTVFWQLGAASGRMSCGSRNTNEDLAKLKGISSSRCKYVQCQNLPSDEITRSSFIPNEGNLMTACDYSALESRLGADIYNEPAMIKEYLEGSGDIHSLVAKACFPIELEGISVSEIKNKRPDLRKKAKAPEFACQFENF